VLKILDDNAIPYFPTPGRTATAAAALNSFSTKLRRSREAAPNRVTKRLPLSFPSDAKLLSEREAKLCLDQYGIPTVKEMAVPAAEIESLSKIPFKFPVVVKIDSRDIPHKTEAHAVRLGVADLDHIKLVAHEIITATLAFKPDASIDGILIQEMAGGIETIIGGVNDPVFGPYVVLGMGGILAEVMRDKAMRYAPFGTAVAHEMIQELKASRLFHGYRGDLPYDIEALAQSVARLSYLISDHQEKIAEIDVNPLFVRHVGAGVVAADCLIALRV
jgi:acetyltransferase